MNDITSLFAEYGEVRKDADNWRLTPRVTGAFNGLPMTRGTIVATNGILALVDCGRGALFEGHFDFFVKEPRKRATSARTDKTSDIDNLVFELLL